MSHHSTSRSDADRTATAPPAATEPTEVLDFWFGELDSEGLASPELSKRWWAKDPELDALIRQRFGALHEQLSAGDLATWPQDARSRLAAVIVLDQFSRNMYRDTAGMFAADERALSLAIDGIERGLDRELPVDMRTFLYMPLMHSEQVAVQDRCVELFRALRRELRGKAEERVAHSVKFAKMHRDIVARFGRFPHRNAALGRDSTETEVEFLQQPGSSF